MHLLYTARWWIDDGTYVAEVPDVPGCITTADTFTGLIENITDALAHCLITRMENDIQNPDPSEPESLFVFGKELMAVDVDLKNYI